MLLFGIFPNMAKFSFTDAAETVSATMASPQLTLILPRGVQRGGEHTLQFRGARLATAEEVFLYDADADIEIISVTPVDANRVDVVLRVGSTCRLGEHVAQLRTRDGISDFRSFYVGALPEIEEVEPTSAFDQAQEIELGVTINGVVQNEDIDYFRFQGKQGQRVSIEAEAIRLGFMFDPAISLLDENRFELAVSDDTPLTQQDSWISAILPRDGDYWVAVREAAFQGNGNCRYRLHVGTFGRPAVVFPAGGKPGETVQLKFAERLVGTEDEVTWIEREIELPQQTGFRGGLLFEDEMGIAPSPVPFQLNNLDNFFEPENNQTFPDSPLVDLSAYQPEYPGQEVGIAINGIISEERQNDYFRFTAKQNQVFHVRCLARTVGSGLDPVLNIFDAEKKSIVGNDDSGGPDSYIRFQVPADGDYFFRVRDHLGRGRSDFIYRLEVVAATPQLQFGIARNDRYSQDRQTLVVPQGSRFAVLIDAIRAEFGGELMLVEDDLPAGLKIQAVPMAANLNRMPVVIEAAADAPIGGQLIDLKMKHVDANANISGSFRNLADFALGPPNNRLYYGCEVDKLAVAVVEPLPFRLEMVQPQAPLVQLGSMNVKVIAHRDEGFDKPITVYFPFLSPGVGTTVKQTIPADKSEIFYPINANDKAQLGTWPMYVIGSADIGGAAWASTQLASLAVEEPFLKIEFERVNVEQGQATRFYGKIEHLRDFAGDATAEIVGVPPKIELQKSQTFTQETGELIFEVQTTAESPVGKHAPFCQVTLIQNGEPVTFRAGNIPFQVVKPLPKTDEISDPE